ncbi:MAG TPA: hypothetical protein VFX92_04025 [Candidatus Krumholzibacteria bacterium]|nr:hypothetical protein [Candidatus Krumholzibacteria bacterium]
MTVLSVTALTNFLLACEVFLFAGMLLQRPKQRYSAAWFWCGVFVLLGFSALLGGIDHGFFEAQGLPRYVLQRGNWLVIGLVSFCMLMTTAEHFFVPRARRIVAVVGAVQLLAYTVAIYAAGSFALVIVNYVPVLGLLLVMSVRETRRGSGSAALAAGLVVMLLASAIQALHVDRFSPLNASGLYHVVLMAGVVFLYRGGVHLRTVRDRP